MESDTPMAGEEDAAIASTRWLIGVGLGSLAPLLNNVGLNLQKVAHAKLQLVGAGSMQGSSTDNVPATAYLKNKLWIFGLILVIAASILDFVALGFAPQSVIAPLGALNLMLNVVVIPFMQGVYPTRRDVVGMSVAFGGCVLCVVFASHNDMPFEDVEDVFGVYNTLNFWLYATVVIIWGIAGYLALRRYEKIRCEHGVESPMYQKYIKYHRFLLASNAGMVGAQSVLFAKSTASLVMIMVRPDKNGEMFQYAQTYIIVAMMFVTVWLQLKWLNDGLQRFSSMYTVPVFQAFWIIISVLGGMICYDEMRGLSLVNQIMFIAGVCFVMLGVYTLSGREVEGEEENRKIASAGGAPRADRSSYKKVTMLTIEDPQESAEDMDGGISTDTQRSDG